MVKILLGLLSICLVINTLRCETPKEEDDVLVLTKDNFDATIKAHKYILVEFYAPWCGHCKKLAPEYAKAAGSLKAEKSEIRLAKVDATQEGDLSERYQVQGYPTLKLFIDEKPIEYGGGRTADEIVLWLKKKSGPAAETISSVEQLNKLKEANRVAVIGLFKSLDSAEAQTYLKVAKETDDVSFGISSEQAIFDELGVSQDTVVLLKNFDEGRNDFRSWETELRSFIVEKQIPLVWELNEQTQSKIFSSNIRTFVFLFVSKKSSKYEEQLNELKKAAENYRNKAVFVILNVDDEAPIEQIMNLLSVTKDSVPEIGIVNIDEGLKKFKGVNVEINADGIQAFVKDYFNHKLKPFLFSENLPEDWNSKPVKVLVSKNFNEVARDKSKTVLVEFYAPWCGHCKKLEPIYNELGEKFASRSDEFIIAKMDATKNELEDLQVQGFPTIKLYPKGSDEVIEFNGERNLDALTRFVESLGKDNVEKPKDEL